MRKMMIYNALLFSPNLLKFLPYFRYPEALYVVYTGDADVSDQQILEGDGTGSVGKGSCSIWLLIICIHLY